MKPYLLLIGALLVSSLAQAKDLTVNVGGKDVAVQYRVLEREIAAKDRDTGRPFSEASKVLGKALNMINEGKLKL